MPKATGRHITICSPYEQQNYIKRNEKKKSISWITLYLKPDFSKELYYFQVTYYGP